MGSFYPLEATSTTSSRSLTKNGGFDFYLRESAKLA